MEDKKWFSNDYTEEKVLGEKLTKGFAKISKPTFGTGDGGFLGLMFALNFDNGDGTDLYFDVRRREDIQKLLSLTHSSNINELHGKVVEGYKDRDTVKCISVNENLI